MKFAKFLKTLFDRAPSVAAFTEFTQCLPNKYISKLDSVL